MPEQPPIAESGWALTAAAVIDAPVEVVWQVLTDFPKYPEWNPFVRKQVLTDATTNNVLENQAAVEGAILNMTVQVPPSMSADASPQQSSCVISHVDNENHRVAWRYALGGSTFSWMLKSHRWQSVTATADGKAKYENIEVFNGMIVFLLKWIVGTNLQKSFNAMAEALKARAEQLHRDNSS